MPTPGFPRRGTQRVAGTLLAIVTAVTLGVSAGAVEPGAAEAESGDEVGALASCAPDPVTSLADWDAAIAAANGTACDTINLATGTTIAASAESVYTNGTHALTINGNGSTLDGDGTFRLFRATAGPIGGITFNDLTFTDGTAPGGENGGAISVVGAVTCNRCVFRANQATNGGAVQLGSETATFVDSTFEENEAVTGGGAISGTEVDLVSRRTTFTSNATGSGGGAIHIVDGTITIESSTFTMNTAGVSGGAVLAEPAFLTVTGSTFSQNSAGTTGGAIHSGTGISGPVANISTSSFTGNTTGSSTAITAGGGAIALFDLTPATITSSTFSGNRGITRPVASLAQGGAILAIDLIVASSTIVMNSVTGSINFGGGINARFLDLTYSTVTGNSAALGANIALNNESAYSTPGLETFGSVIAEPLGGGTNCVFNGAGDLTISSADYGYTYVTDTSCFVGAAATALGTQEVGAAAIVVPGGNPLLGPLGNNGGPTPTRLPLAGSPLLNAIPAAACRTAPLATNITTGQRGIARPQGSGCDIGAVEVVEAITKAPAFTG